MSIHTEILQILKQYDSQTEEILLREISSVIRKHSHADFYGKEEDEFWNEFSEISAAIESSLLLARIDTEGHIIKVNTNFQIVLGYSSAELCGMPMTVLSEGLHDPGYLNALWDKIRHGSIWRGEISKKTPDGKIVWLNATIIPIVGFGGNISHYLSFYIDISRRKKVEGDLELFYQLVNLSNDAIHVVDEAGNLIYVNEKSLDNLGYTRGELLGKNIVDIEKFFKTREDWAEHLKEIKSNPTGMLIRGSHIRKDGTMFPVEVNARFMEFAGKGYVIAVIRDISDRIRGERLMSKTRHILSEAQLLAKIASFEIDMEANSLLHSDNTWQVFGFPNSDSFSVSELFNQVHQDDRDKLQKAWETVTVDKHPVRVEFRVWSHRKEVLHMLGMAKALPDESGSENTVLCTAQNITESVEVRLDLEKRRQELEKRNRELDQFAQIVSHDLKSPLRAIHNLSEWIRESEDPKEQSAFISKLHRRVQRMENLINGILTYSSAGKKIEGKTLFSAGEVLHDIAESLKTGKEQVRIILEDMPDLIADLISFEQVMSNLISNSVKHNDNPNPEVIVQYEFLPDRHRFLIIDNGPGIEERYREKVFQIFQTLDARDKSENTGVGLAIVKKLCEENGWKIRIMDPPSSGACFELEIPLL